MNLDVEWLRLANTVTGSAAFALLVFRLVARWDVTTPLSKIVVILLSAAVLVLALGSAEAARAGAPFNWVAWLALAVNAATVAVGVMWHRVFQATGRL